MLLSIVVPVYKEEKNILPFLQRIRPVLSQVTEDYEIIFSMDPAPKPDKTEELIRNANSQDPRVKLLKFSRRFGQPMATIAGLEYSQGEAAIAIDVDLQDPPELIVEMVKAWREEGSDVVYAQRRTRQGETLIKKFVSYVGYKIINAIADVEIPPNTGDFRLMNRRVINQVVRFKESHGFLRGLVALVGFKQTAVLFDRAPRHSGQGNYNRFLGSLKIGVNGLVCFSNSLLTISTKLGLFIAFASFIMAIIYFMLKVEGHPFPMGNPTIVIAVLFLGGVQLISVGILGEYISRIYDEVRMRPKYIVDQSMGFTTLPESVNSSSSHLGNHHATSSCIS